MLLNFQLNDRCLLTLILLGQSDLKEMIARQRPLHQRIPMRLSLSPLSEEDTASYIHFRLKTAGARKRIFTDKAIKLIHQEAEGIPRSINNLCDLCLLEGVRAKVLEVEQSLVKTVMAFT